MFKSVVEYRQNTYAGWASTVIPHGEVVVEVPSTTTATYQFKEGDGSTTYPLLPYLSPSSIGAQEATQAFNASALGTVPLVSGRYYRAPNGTLGTSATLGVGTFRCVPKFIPSATTISRLGAEVSTVGEAGSKLRLGIYADDGTFRPGALVLDAGTIAGDSNTVQEITGLSTTLSRGWYFFGGAVQVVSVTQPTVRALAATFEYAPLDYTAIPTAGAASVGFSMTGVTGALPATFTVGNIVGSAPSLFMRIA